MDSISITKLIVLSILLIPVGALLVALIRFLNRH